MITASKLAGFMAAHAIWCVSDNDSPVPMLGYTTEDGQRHMERLVFDRAEAAVEHGRGKLKSDEMNADDAVLVYDGRIPIETTKVDAIIIEMRAYFSPWSEAVIAVPYSPKSTGKFLVHKPKLLVWKDCDDFDMDWAIESFLEGIAEHEQGSKIWTDSLDESR